MDNRGRRSLRALTAGLDDLEIGQRLMRIFDLVGFTPGEEITLRSRVTVFDDVAVTYRASSAGADRSRLAVKVLGRHRRDALGLLWTLVLPAGDLFMMRKQLVTLARLAETDARSRQ